MTTLKLISSMDNLWSSETYLENEDSLEVAEYQYLKGKLGQGIKQYIYGHLKPRLDVAVRLIYLPEVPYLLEDCHTDKI